MLVAPSPCVTCGLAGLSMCSSLSLPSRCSLAAAELLPPPAAALLLLLLLLPPPAAGGSLAS
jgi:hypothetical protein